MNRSKLLYAIEEIKLVQKEISEISYALTGINYELDALKDELEGELLDE